MRGLDLDRQCMKCLTAKEGPKDAMEVGVVPKDNG
jgi:hypothetical protein